MEIKIHEISVDFFAGNYFIEYADKFPQDDETISTDLEEQNTLSKISMYMFDVF